MDIKIDHNLLPKFFARQDICYTYLSLPAVGFKQQIPQKLLGILRLPPMSVPKPRRDPPDPIRAPSPPEDPPGPLKTLWGFTVVP